jgi:DNA repair photolyase
MKNRKGPPASARSGRGSDIAPTNRFESVAQVDDFEQLDVEDALLLDDRTTPTQFLPDNTQTIVAHNNSPDVSFSHSVNPYRGCEHGCAYCFARPGHEYLGMNAGLDFESKIMVKHKAPELLRKFLLKKSWKAETIIFSGVTDCYQPVERRLRLTRGCLEVTLEARQPISIITKNALVTRDLDLLAQMAALRLVHVNVSITTLNPELARVMEPRTSVPDARLRAVKMLSEAGVPVRVMTAPIIPGLNDSEIPALLAAAKEAGAGDARYVLLRLPLTVKPVFLEWLHRTQPLKAEKIEGLVRQTRDGKMYQTEWGTRQVGSGQIAEQIQSMFEVFRTKHGFGDLPEHDHSIFRPPHPQMRLF